MSNVASLELCRELYELSGGPKSHSSWHNTEKAWAEVAIEHKPPSQPIWAYRVVKNDFQALNEFYPAYDAGYLLRKLPHRIKFQDFELHQIYEDDWEAGYTYNDDWKISASAPTPEDALCSLAIALFKANVLTKETK